MIPLWLTNCLSRNVPVKPALWLVIITSCFLVVSCDDNSARTNAITLNGLTMGTTYTVKINEPGSIHDATLIKKSIDNLLVDLNAKMSTYLPESELSRINQTSTADWINISADLYEVIEEAIKINIQSDGAFDITVGSLVNLWGFGPVEKQDLVPGNEKIQTTLLDTGIDKIHLHSTNKAIKKDRPDIYLDLSGIAKGFAVDRISQLLREQFSIHNYLVEVGGEIQAEGVNSDNQTWLVGVEKPVSSDRMVERIISLENTSMATSGDYRNFFEKNGIHYSHIIDPRTGNPVTHQLVSVTVLHAKAMVADAWATALEVLGPEKGMELANQLELPVLFIVRKNNLFSEIMSARFEQYIRQTE